MRLSVSHLVWIFSLIFYIKWVISNSMISTGNPYVNNSIMILSILGARLFFGRLMDTRTSLSVGKFFVSVIGFAFFIEYIFKIVPPSFHYQLFIRYDFTIGILTVLNLSTSISEYLLAISREYICNIVCIKTVPVFPKNWSRKDIVVWSSTCQSLSWLFSCKVSVGDVQTCAICLILCEIDIHILSIRI